MMAAFLDSFVFECTSDANEDEVFSLISSLLQWREFADSNIVETYVSEQAVDCLAQSGCGFPPWAALAECIRRRQLPITPQDVMSLINGLLTRLPKIEEEIGVRDILIDNVRCVPSIQAARAHVFRLHFERLLALMCLFSEARDLGVADSCSVLSRGLEVCPVGVDFSAQLLDIDPADLLPIPRGLAITTEVFGCARRYLDAIDPVRLWAEANSDAAFAVAIRIFSERAARVSGNPNISNFHIGRKFLASIGELGLRHERAARAVLKACSDTILRQNMIHTHAIRTTTNANSPQLHRGRDTAWRRDVDHELHLHYWSTSEGPEFAAVRMHNDVTIPG